jgi:hypothetical protein
MVAYLGDICVIIKFSCIFRDDDPIFTLCSALKRTERLSTSKKILKIPNTLHKRKSKKQNKEINVTDLPNEEPLKVGEPSNSAKCSLWNIVPVQVPFPPVSTETSQSLSLSPNSSLFPPPPLMNGTSQLPFMQQFLNLNALILARNIQQMSSRLCEKCKLRQDPNCLCALTLPQGLGLPILSGLPPLLPFLPQPSLLDHSRMGMPSLPPLWHPTSQGMFQYPTSTVTSSVLSVLNDHCYLNKAQMQKFSPKSHQSSVPDSQLLTQNKVNQTKSSNDKKSNHMIKVEKSHMSSSKYDRPYCTSIKFALESPSDQNCQHLDVSHPDIHTQTNQVKEEKQELPADTPNMNDDMSQSAVIVKDNLILGRSASEQYICDKTVDNDQTVPSRKRKMVRSTSVPGWFGKGLSLKKKRRI